MKKSFLKISCLCAIFIGFGVRDSLNAMEKVIIPEGAETVPATVAINENVFAVTQANVPGATLVKIYDRDTHQLVKDFFIRSKGKNSYTLLHPDRAICAVFHGRKDDVVAHFVLYDFALGDILLSDICGNTPVSGVFSEDGAIFTYAREDVVHVYDLKLRRLKRVFYKDVCTDIKFSSRQKKWQVAALLPEKNMIGLGDVYNNNVHLLETMQGWVCNGCEFNKNGSLLGMVSVDDNVSSTQVLLWDLETLTTKGSCKVPGILSSGRVLGALQKMYFYKDSSWCALHTFLPDTGYLTSYKIDARSMKVVGAFKHSIDTSALFDSAGNRCMSIEKNNVRLFDWDTMKMVKTWEYKNPHDVVVSKDATQAIIAYNCYQHGIEKIELNCSKEG